MNRVWIDTDMGFDDLAAVLTVAHTPGWTIDGISLVAGNAPMNVVADNALRSKAFFGWTFPIYTGCDRPLKGELVTAQNILGGDAMKSAGRTLPPTRGELTPGHAMDALRNYLQQSPEPATILALGPLTNIAALLQQNPELACSIDKLLWMGGSAGAGNHTAAAEFNAAVDPEAVQVVLDAALPFHMVGLDACRQVRVRAADAQVLRDLATDRGQVLADLLLGYVRIAGADGSLPMALYDPTAAAALVCTEGMAWREAHVVMELEGRHTRGMTVCEFRVPRKANANARVASAANETMVLQVVMDALQRTAIGGGQ